MKIKLQSNQTIISLDKRNFLASGGEGNLYRKGETIYKICEAGKVISTQKIKELKPIESAYVIVPQQLILDEYDREIGYTLKFVPDTYVLCQIFTKAFRQRNNISPQTILKLIQQMQSTIKDIHSKSILLVDLNEFNFLVDDQFKSIYFIDTNSYQTPSFPATAIMESIRDRHAKKFSVLSDWFSFGIISFQMFSGIHPFKGKHEQYKDLDSRMKNNLSILSREVTYPKGACYDFHDKNIVPEVYQRWYKAIFEGLRIPPPEGLTVHVDINYSSHRIAVKSGFLITEIDIPPQNVITIDFKQYPVSFDKLNHTCSIGGVNFPAEQFMICNNILYLKFADRIDKICYSTILKNHFYAQKEVNCLPYATRLENGLCTQNIFGEYFIDTFYNRHQLHLKELSGHKVLEIKSVGNVIIALSAKQGLCYKHTYWNDSSSVIVDPPDHNLNFTVLDNELFVEIPEDGKMILKKGDQTKIIDNQDIRTDWHLSHIGNQVVITYSGKTYRLEIK